MSKKSHDRLRDVTLWLTLRYHAAYPLTFFDISDSDQPKRDFAASAEPLAEASAESRSFGNLPRLR